MATTDQIVKAMVTEYWGERCPEYEEGCACCAAWKLFDETGKFHGLEEVIERMD